VGTLRALRYGCRSAATLGIMNAGLICERCGAERDSTVMACPRCSALPSFVKKQAWAKWLPRFRLLGTLTLSATAVLALAMLFVAPVVGAGLSVSLFAQYFVRDYLTQRCNGEEATLLTFETVTGNSSLAKQRFYDLYAVALLFIALVASFAIAIQHAFPK
jgi:hypothetical protein